jgi:hypothetical protein
MRLSSLLHVAALVFYTQDLIYLEFILTQIQGEGLTLFFLLHLN